MSIFLILCIIGLAGLVMMAIPGIGKHGHAAGHIAGHTTHGGLRMGHGHHGGQVPNASHGQPQGSAKAPTTEGAPGETPMSAARLIPSPRMIFSLLALYGAFGYGLVEAGNLHVGLAAILAAAPAILLERYAVTPLWNLCFRFQGTPCAPLTNLVLQEAEAVTPFRNGRGLVSVEREGRTVQFSATLMESQQTMPVKVGDRLHIEEVDEKTERLKVSL